MRWTKRDEETVNACRACIEHCRHYHGTPAPWFPLLIKMHEELERAGLLEAGTLETDYCADCVFQVGGGCRKAYAEAALDESRQRVVNCRKKTTETQKAALERAAEKMTRPAHRLAAGRSRP